MAGISNFGLFWDRALVHWGTRGRNNAGHLRGYAEYKNDKYIQLVDFREQAGVYVLQNSNREFQYIGQVGRSEKRGLFLRLKEHANGKLANRWTHFSWFGLHNVIEEGSEFIVKKDTNIKKITVTDALDQFEGILIQLIEPRLNSKGANWGNIKEYYQFCEEDEVEDWEKKLNNIHLMIESMSSAKAGAKK
jgi:hypothetical protein